MSKSEFNVKVFRNASAAWKMDGSVGELPLPYDLERRSDVAFLRRQGDDEAESLVCGGRGFYAEFNSGCLEPDHVRMRAVYPKSGEISVYLRFSSVLSGEVGVKIFASEDAALSVEIYYNADTDKFGVRGCSRNRNEITVQHKKTDAVEFEIFVDKCIFEAFLKE